MFAAHHRLAQPRRDRRPERPAGARLHRATCSTSRRWPSAGAPSAGTCTRSTATTPTRSRATLAGLDTRDGPPHVLVARTVVRQGRLVHGAPDQVALLADVRRRSTRRRSPRSSGGRDERRVRRARSSSSPSADDRDRAADRRPRLHGARAVRRALPGPLLQRRRRRAEHGRHRDRPRRGRLRPVRLLDRHLRVAAAVRVHPQRPGAARAAGAHRRRRRRLRVRPQRRHALRARGRRRDARAAGHDGGRAGRPPRRPRGAARDLGRCPAPSTTGSARTTRPRCPASTAASSSAAPSVLGDGARRRARRAGQRSRARRVAAADAARRAAASRATVAVVASAQPAAGRRPRRRCSRASRSR